MTAYADTLWDWLRRNPVKVPRPPPNAPIDSNLPPISTSIITNDDSPPESYPVHIEPPRLFALIIAVEKYASDLVDDLDGPVSDANAMRAYLENKNHLGVPKSHIQHLYDSDATRTNIIEGIRALKSNENIQKNDPILIYFSGHGGEHIKKLTDGSIKKTQMILPYDFRLDSGKDKIYGILDVTIGVLLEFVAQDKGDNITVIFDCCYSGSGTRKIGSNRRSRGIKVPEEIPDDLDKDILKGSRAAEIHPEFLYRGLQSHVLIAACNENEKAMEEDGRGVFTVALIDTLAAAGAAKLTYSDLLLRLPHLPQQTPQCEGVNKRRLLFDGKARDMGVSFFKVHVEGSLYTLDAGAAHGVTDGAEFTLYERPDDYYAGKSLGVLVTQKVDIFSSVLVLPRQIQLVGRLLGNSLVLTGDVFALQTRVGIEEDIRLHVAELSLLPGVVKDLEAEIRRPGPSRRRFVLVERKFAQLSINLSGDWVIFEILNPFVIKCGLVRMPYRTIPERIPSVIQAAAHFEWHLRRTPAESSDFEQLVRLEFTEVVKERQTIKVKGPNLNVDGKVEITVGDSKYGMKLINDSKTQLYPYLFFFDCSDLTIETYYDSPTAEEAAGKAPLQPGGFLTIGYGTGGWAPWKYSLRKSETLKAREIMQDGQEVDVGFLKLFLSTKPLDLSCMEQESPFLPPYAIDYRGGSRHQFESIGLWDTKVITVVQQRGPTGGIEELPDVPEVA